MLNIIPVFDIGHANPNDCHYLFCNGHISTVKFAIGAYDAKRIIDFLCESLDAKTCSGSLVVGSLVVTVGESNSPEVSHDGQMQQVVMVYPLGDFVNMKVAESAHMFYSRLKEAISSAKQVTNIPPKGDTVGN